jgi:protein SCO1/2
VSPTLSAVPLRARLAVLVAASFVVAGAFFATLGSSEDRPRAATRFEGSLRPPGIRPAEFRMRDQDGKLATLGEYRGRPVVVTFLYTTCEDTCPLTAQQIRGALDELGHDVPAYAIAVDPPRDTPERAKRFLAEQRVTGRMRFLLGPRSQLQAQWKAFAIQRQTEDLEHSAYTILVDRAGRQRVAYPSNALIPEDLAQDIALLERES